MATPDTTPGVSFHIGKDGFAFVNIHITGLAMCSMPLWMARVFAAQIAATADIVDRAYPTAAADPEDVPDATIEGESHDLA